MKKLTKYQIQAIKDECSDRVLKKKQQEFEKRFAKELAQKNKLKKAKEKLDREIAVINEQISVSYGVGFNQWADTVHVMDLHVDLNKLERDLTLKQIDGVSCEDVIAEFVKKFE